MWRYGVGLVVGGDGDGCEGGKGGIEWVVGLFGVGGVVNAVVELHVSSAKALLRVEW